MWAPDEKFLGQGDNSSSDEKAQSVRGAIVDAIEGVKYDDTKITIRFISGSKGVVKPEMAQKNAESIFWPGGKPLVTKHTNATLHLGFYSPTFDLK
jgi:hypothetical protein